MRRSPSARSVGAVVERLDAELGEPVHALARPGVRPLPVRVDEAAGLEAAQGAVERARVGMVKAEGGEAVGELVAVGIALAQEEQQTGAEEVPGQTRTQRVWHTVPPGRVTKMTHSFPLRRTAP